MSLLLIQLFAVVLGLAIVVVEAGRGRRPGHVDFLRMASAVYFVCFAVVPVYLQYADLSSLRSTWFWLFRRPFGDDSFALAEATALVGYASLLLGFVAGKSLSSRVGRVPLQAEPFLTRGVLTSLGHLVGLTGLVSLVVYTYSIGGIGPLILQAVAFRSHTPPVVSRVAFLKTLAPLSLAAAMVFYALVYTAGSKRQRRSAVAAFWIYFATALVCLFHQAGRYPLAAFLLTFPVARMVRTDTIRLRSVVVTAGLVFALLLFGKQLFESGFNPGAMNLKSSEIVSGGGSLARSVLTEFAFPTVTLSNTVVEVPAEVPYRWFYDFPLAIQYLLPQTLTGLTHPPTVSMVNSVRFGYYAYGAIPVDLVSLGYFSAGLPGVVLILGAFGGLLALFERLLPATSAPLGAVLRVAWMFFLGMRVLYGDPQLIWSGGLHLVALSGLLVWLRAYLARPPVSEAVVPAGQT